MATNLAANRIYGDAGSAVSVAPKGTTGPIGLAALATPFDDLGWLGEDGVAIARKVDKKVFKAHQGGAVIRTKITGTENGFKFQCLEETAIVLGLMHAGSTGVTAAGVSTVTIPGSIGPDERVFVVDEFDGEIQTRYVFPTGQVGDRGDIVLKTDEMTLYEFNVDVTGDFTMVTNSTAVVYPIS